jgi:hypothetical protein
MKSLIIFHESKNVKNVPYSLLHQASVGLLLLILDQPGGTRRETILRPQSSGIVNRAFSGETLTGVAYLLQQAGQIFPWIRG